MDNIKIGIIGGSGLSEMKGFNLIEEKVIDTPFGKPSDAVVIGELAGKKVAFLPRHGKGHFINPTEINFRANIYALKSLGVRIIISASAVGSMKEEIAPGHLVIPDQLFDRTKARASTFFTDGLVVHIPFDKPFCPQLSDLIYEQGKELGLDMHKGGTYICIEGPQFSTKAESKVYRSWGVDVIGMTNIPEAKLAREAEICYATIAMSTDYDVWREGEEVSVEKVLATVKKNVENVKALLKKVIGEIDPETDCSCRHVLRGSVQTSPGNVNKDTVKKLDIIIGKYIE